MLIRVDAGSAEPIFEQIAASVRGQIAAGAVARGDRLPPAREVAQALDVNVHTVLHAYQTLRDEGVIEMRPGRGARVAVDAPTATVQELARDYVARARAAGLADAAALALVRRAQEARP